VSASTPSTGRAVDPRRDLVQGAAVLALVGGLGALRVGPAGSRDQQLLERALELAAGSDPSGGQAPGLLERVFAALLRIGELATGGAGSASELGLLLVATLGPVALAITVASATGAAQGLGLPRRLALLASAVVGLALLPHAGWPSLEILTAAAAAWTWTRVLDVRAARERGRAVGIGSGLALGLGVVTPTLLESSLLPLSLLLLAAAELALVARPRGAHEPSRVALAGLGAAAPLLVTLLARGASGAPIGPGLALEWSRLGAGADALLLGSGGLLLEAPLLAGAALGLGVLVRAEDRLAALAPLLTLVLAAAAPLEHGAVLLAAAVALAAVPLTAGATALVGHRGGRLAMGALLLWGSLAASGAVLVDPLRVRSLELTALEAGVTSPVQPLLRWRLVRREWALPEAAVPLAEVLGAPVEGELPRAADGPQGHLALGLMGTVRSLFLPAIGLLVLVAVGLRALGAGLDRARPGP